MNTRKEYSKYFEDNLHRKYQSSIVKVLALITLVVFSMLISNPTSAQNTEDTNDERFHDDLLNHLVGKWEVTGVVYGIQAKLTFQAEWVLNHQFLRVYEKSEGNVPGTNAPFEAFLFIGFENYTKRYVTHLMTANGGLCAQNTIHTYRTGNEIKLVITEPCTIGVERFIWEPASGTWKIESRLLNDGKEGELYLDLKAVPAKSSPN